MGALADLMALLDEIECRAYTLHATDSSYWTARNSNLDNTGRVNLRLTIIGRGQFEQVCSLLGAKATERIVNTGQRSWWAESNSDTRKLLIEGVSFQHHDDWEART